MEAAAAASTKTTCGTRTAAVEIRDRRKDIIISGERNIASVEVEQVLASSFGGIESAVIGVPDDGGIVAFVMLRKSDVDASALTDYARAWPGTRCPPHRVR